MKKTIVLFSAMTMSLATLFVACKKESSQQPGTTHSATVTKNTKSAARITVNVTVSDRGMLVFNSFADVNDYVAFLESSTLAEVSQFHGGLGFTSLGGNKYVKLDQNSLVTEDQLEDFMLDSKGLVEVNGTIFKLTPDNLYLLTMLATQLDDNTYSMISTGKFDGSVMNRFATRIERDDTFDFSSVLAHSPFGINETDPGGQASLMKFWGKVDYAGPCNAGMSLHTVLHYAFFIRLEQYEQYYVPC